PCAGQEVVAQDRRVGGGLVEECVGVCPGFDVKKADHPEEDKANGQKDKERLAPGEVEGTLGHRSADSNATGDGPHPRRTGRLTFWAAAPWRSGYAAACKAVYAGSIPAGALLREAGGFEGVDPAHERQALRDQAVAVRGDPCGLARDLDAASMAPAM